MILYRPVGLQELLLIYKTGLRRFPPRLPEQPIFYPVLTIDYATQIARDWNTRSGSLAGYVTEFDLDDDYGQRWPVQQAGSRQHRELWIPAEELDAFNRHIRDRIRVIDACFSPAFSGVVPASFSLRGKDARAQLGALGGIYSYSLVDFHGEITANHDAVFAHFPYWQRIAASHPDTLALLTAIRQVWSSAFPEIPLGIQASHAPRTSGG